MPYHLNLNGIGFLISMVMGHYLVLITLAGLAALGMAWMPALTERFKISYSIVYVLLGILIYAVFDDLPRPDPLGHPDLTVRITELVVIVSLMGTGLKIDQKFTFRSWRIPILLVTLTMVLMIAAMTAVAYWFLNFDIASALLLAAVLAPTDPVLASDVQVGPPLEDKHDNVRFTLTAEAGMNDGMAFPFTWLAIMLAHPANSGWLEWWGDHLLFKIAVGLISGFLIGKAIAWILFRNYDKENRFSPSEGFVAICTTLITYGITELLQGYGFIAVFVAAITIRNYEMHHDYHRTLHSFTDQIERVLLAIVLILLGGAIYDGILANINWKIVLVALASIFLIRPLITYLSISRSELHRKEKWAISFFGIKGMGSFFYLAFALSITSFGHADELWTTTAAVVILSLIVHGVTAPFVMMRISERFSRSTK